MSYSKRMRLAFTGSHAVVASSIADQIGNQNQPFSLLLIHYRASYTCDGSLFSKWTLKKSQGKKLFL